MTVDQDGFAQVTDEVRLEGDGVQLAKQFRDGVLHPVLMKIERGQGSKDVVAFLSCILLQAALDIQAICDTDLAEAALQEVKQQLAIRQAKKASH